MSANNTQAISADEMFRRKAEYRCELAKLPIEEKLRRMVVMQAVNCSIKRATGRPYSLPWGTKEKAPKT